MSKFNFKTVRSNLNWGVFLNNTPDVEKRLKLDSNYAIVLREELDLVREYLKEFENLQSFSEFILETHYKNLEKGTTK